MSNLSLADDGAMLSPAAMAQRLADLTQSGSVSADYYGAGGPVAELEAECARLLGKEDAVMFPTGTLANALAARAMSAGRTGARFILHRDSHIYNDAGDNFTALAGVTMVPLVSEGASFSAEQVSQELSRTAAARVGSSVVGISIETPNRRLANRRFDSAEAQRIASLAKDAGVPLLLDAARLFIEAEWSGQMPDELAAPYDYVYISLYKYLDAPFGAVLAGPVEKLAPMRDDRRRFGGGLYQMWPAALLALHALPRQTQVWAGIHRQGEAVRELLGQTMPNLVRYPDDANVLRIADDRSTAEPGARAKAMGIKLTPPNGGYWTLKMNETWLGLQPEEIAARISEIFV